MLAFVLFFVALLLGLKPLGKGIILGTIFSVLNFIVMSELIPNTLGKSTNRAVVVSLLSKIPRLALMAVPLIIAMKSDSIEFFGAAAGLFMVQVIIMFDHVILKKIPFFKRA